MFFDLIEQDFAKITGAEFSRPVLFRLGSISQDINCIFHSTYYTINAAGERIQSNNPVIIISQQSFFDVFGVELEEENKTEIEIKFKNVEYYISRIEPTGTSGLVLELKRD